VGTRPDAALAMELGADGVHDTAIAGADEPVAMAEAMSSPFARPARLSRAAFRRSVRDRQQPVLK
jgi:thiazole synthase ThiGH ThiG subunit